MRRLVAFAFFLLAVPYSRLHAQSSTLTPLAPTLARSEGIEPTSNIAFTRLYLTAQSDPTPTEFDISHPTLTIQCTKRLNGKYLFELFVNFGGVTDIAFYPPWRPVNDQDHFPPHTDKLTLTMEFLGYTKVKPVKREFEAVIQPDHQLRYNPPSSGSRNLEEIAFYFQYLRALPTFHINDPTHSATFLTEPLLTQIRKESLCKASGL
jgi:hypothetical protein